MYSVRFDFNDLANTQLYPYQHTLSPNDALPISLAPCLLPTLLPKLRREWPDLKLFLREETSQAACDSLHRGQLDCVLLALPYNCGEVESFELFEDRLFVAFPPGMPEGVQLPATGATIEGGSEGPTSELQSLMSYTYAV